MKGNSFDHLEEITSWIESRFKCPRRSGDYLIDRKMLEPLCEIAIEESKFLIREDSDDREMIRLLLTVLLLEESDERRGLIGPLAINISPINVAGALLATITMLDWISSGSSVSSPNGILAIAAALQSALSAVSLLSREEKEVVARIAIAQRILSPAKIRLSDLETIPSRIAMGKPELATVLTSLVAKDALAWNQDPEGHIQLKKWF